MRKTRPKSLIERATRFFAHPLVRYDPEAVNGGIQVLKLEYLEAETTRAPVPRNQDVPKKAFGRLTGRSILVATSHAWFHQYHPDPDGVILEIMRKDFLSSFERKISAYEDFNIRRLALLSSVASSQCRGSIEICKMYETHELSVLLL